MPLAFTSPGRWGLLALSLNKYSTSRLEGQAVPLEKDCPEFYFQKYFLIVLVGILWEYFLNYCLFSAAWT